MGAFSQKLQAFWRRILARYLRSNVIAYLLPCSTALMFAIFVIAWSRDGIVLLRDQAKQGFYNDLMRVESQVNTIIRSEFDRITMVSSNLSNHIDRSGHIDPSDFQNVSGRTEEIWVPNQSNTQLEAFHQRPILLESSAHIVAGTDHTNQALLRNEWNALRTGKPVKIDPSSILNQGNIAISEASGAVSFIVPILGQNGLVKGLVCSRIRASKFQALLPENTFLLDSMGSSIITKDGINPSEVSLNQSIQEHDPRFELFSSARRIPISKSAPAWRLRSDHTNSEMWSKPEFKRLLDFNGAVLILILSFTYIWIQSSNRVRNRQRKLIGNLTQKIIWITNVDGKIDTVLGNVTDRLGWKQLDYIDVNIGLFVHPDDRFRLEEAIANAKEAATKDDLIEIRFENENHQYRWYEVTATNMIHVPEINGIVLTAHDIEHRMHATTLILASKRAAEMANEAKSGFLSRMSHELRTPLNAILGFGQLLEMDSITEQQADNVDQILIAGRHLLDLVNDILDLAQIENQKIFLKKDHIRVHDVIQECIALMAPLSAKSQVQINFNATSCSDLRSDRQKLKQVVLNLLSNGIKYNTRGGSVEVSLDQTGPGLKILVRDTGIGIKTEYLDRVFTAFDRLGSDSSGVEGTGLGLALSKTFVEAMSGTLEVTSEVGKGSTFSITFAESVLISNEQNARLTLETNEQDQHGQFENPENFRILLIEDNIINLRYISKVVDKMSNVALMSAKEGSIGIELARTYIPDLILLDLEIPDLDCRDVLKSLGGNAPTGCITIVVMADEPAPEVIQEIMNLGAFACVTKPVDVSGLIASLNRDQKAA